MFPTHYCIVPSFNFEVGLRLGWASEIKERVSTQNVFHTNPFFFSFLLLFLSMTGEDSYLLMVSPGSTFSYNSYFKRLSVRISIKVVLFF